MADVDGTPRKAQRIARRSAPVQRLIAVGLGAWYAVVCGCIGALCAGFVSAENPSEPQMWRAPAWLPAVVFAVIALPVFVLSYLGVRDEHRQARESLATAERSEQQMVRTRVELSDIERAVSDRTVEHAELGRRIREASAMLEATEAQVAYVRQAVEQAVARSQRSWWMSVLALLIGIVIGYVTEWTADGLKPSWLP